MFAKVLRCLSWIPLKFHRKTYQPLFLEIYHKLRNFILRFTARQVRRNVFTLIRVEYALDIVGVFRLGERDSDKQNARLPRL